MMFTRNAQLGSTILSMLLLIQLTAASYMYRNTQQEASALENQIRECCRKGYDIIYDWQKDPVLFELYVDNSHKSCPECDGGDDWAGNDCEACDGTGMQKYDGICRECIDRVRRLIEINSQPAQGVQQIQTKKYSPDVTEEDSPDVLFADKKGNRYYDVELLEKVKAKGNKDHSKPAYASPPSSPTTPAGAASRPASSRSTSVSEQFDSESDEEEAIRCCPPSRPALTFKLNDLR